VPRYGSGAGFRSAGIRSGHVSRGRGAREGLVGGAHAVSARAARLWRETALARAPPNQRPGGLHASRALASPGGIAVNSALCVSQPGAQSPVGPPVSWAPAGARGFPGALPSNAVVRAGYVNPGPGDARYLLSAGFMWQCGGTADPAGPLDPVGVTGLSGRSQAGQPNLGRARRVPREVLRSPEVSRAGTGGPGRLW
jgi:hypothetical protein